MKISDQVAIVSQMDERAREIRHDADLMLRSLDNLRRGMVNKPAAPLSQPAWDALVKAEHKLYAGEFGVHAYTEVNPNDGSEMLNVMWDNAWSSVEMQMANDGDLALAGIQYGRTARHVAAALAVIAFGPEFLIK